MLLDVQPVQIGTAGITPAIDLTLALVEEHHGPAVAMAVAKRLMLYLRRSGNQPQLSPALRRQEREPPRLFNISRFVLEHLSTRPEVAHTQTSLVFEHVHAPGTASL